MAEDKADKAEKADKPKRRPYGEGSVANKPRKDGLYRAALVLPNGRRRYFYGRTKTEARRKLNDAKAQLAQGLPVAATVRVSRFLETWLEEVAKQKVRPRTYDHYELYVHHYLIPELGGYKLGQLHPAHIQTFLNEQLARGRAPRTVHHLRAILRNALNTAVRWRLINGNPAAMTEAVTVPKREKLNLSLERVGEIMRAVRGDPMEPLFVLAIATGLRQSELLGLLWSDLDLAERKLSVRRQLQRRSGGYELVEPKTEPSRRSIPIPMVVVELLGCHRLKQEAQKQAAKGEWGEWDLVFTTPLGQPINHTVAFRHFQRVLHRAGLPPMRFHDLRAAYATILSSLGVHPRVAMELMGHTLISTTMEIYAESIAADQRAAVELLERALWKTDSAPDADGNE